jgi:hypothetical protein
VRKLLSVLLSVSLLLLPLVGAQPTYSQQNPPSNQSFVGGRFVARNYIYLGVTISPGSNIPAGAGTISLQQGSVKLSDGRTVVPFSAGGFNILGQPGPFPAIPIYVGAGATRELVTPTAVSGCYVGAPQGNCKITATFANAHGQGEVVTSGSFGIQEAVNDAAFWGGGVVTVDSSLNFYSGSAQTVTTAMAAATVIDGVSIEDDRFGPPTFWNPVAGATTLAAPATLVAATAGFGVNGANFTGGFYTGNSTYIAAITCIDIMGQEGPASASFTIVTSGVATTDQIGFTAPAAQTGCVAWKPYITLASGAYTSAYAVPLVTQPTVVGAYPVSNGVCTLSTVEVTTPGCAITNATYNQTGSGAVVSALTLNTSQIIPQTSVVSTTSIYVPQGSGRTTYTYAPSSNVGTGGIIPASWLAFTISAAPATVVPTVVGTVNFPPQFMNVLGKKIEVCGEMTSTATAATIVDVQIQWDANGQNTAGKGVLIGDQSVTATVATTGHVQFCQDFETTVTSASATGGSINHTGGYVNLAGVTVAAAGGGGDVVTPGAIGSLNLADAARINIIYLHTTATDGAGWILQNLTVKQI